MQRYDAPLYNAIDNAAAKAVARFLPWAKRAFFMVVCLLCQKKRESATLSAILLTAMTRMKAMMDLTRLTAVP